MKLYGLSDLHVGHKGNDEAIAAIPAHPDDWLILAGDLGEKLDQLRFVFDTLGPRWAQLIWVPGNHELWTLPKDPDAHLRGDARYRAMVELCREHGVLSPEDPYPVFPGTNLVIAPLFTLYDYSFAPDGMTPEQAVAWAREDRIMAADEHYLYPDPYESRSAWCAARVAYSEQRLAEVDAGYDTVLINHWPLRRDTIRLFRIPRFVPWCGTRATEDWHTRFRARVVVSGHLHMRATDWRDGVRFEEISLGYPRHWRHEAGAAHYLREILPGPKVAPDVKNAGPMWHR